MFTPKSERTPERNVYHVTEELDFIGNKALDKKGQAQVI
jgi:hypothetical protein